MKMFILTRYDSAQNARDTPRQYLDAAKHLWQFTVVGVSSLS